MNHSHLLKLIVLNETLSKTLMTLLMILFCTFGLLSEIAVAQNKTLTNSTPIQPYLDQAIQKMTEFSLENGMKFIILENHEAPVVSFVTYVDVGGVDEPDGKTGLAHFLEHLAFKGTTLIGTKNYQIEKPLLERLDELDKKIQVFEEQGKPDEVSELKTKFDATEVLATRIVEQNELGRIVEQAGGVDLNATTSTEATRYFYSFPANKLELWMSLESERFLDPVWREFHKEKNVILEERRLRVDNSPIGQMLEKFIGTAYTLHPYRRPVIGYNQDIRNLTRKDIKDFFVTHYIPEKITIAIVGDVNPNSVKELAKVYFGRYQSTLQPKGELEINMEPKQEQRKKVILKLKSQPWYLEGYHRPSINHPDDPVYNIIGRLLSDGRTSRLYKSLVEEQKLALTAKGFSGYPGNKYPNLMLFYVLTAPGQSVDKVASALSKEINLLKTELVSKIELERVKTQARAELLRALDSNMGMAQKLLEYEVKTGSWRNLFKQIDALEAVTANDVLRVSQTTFTPDNCTVGKLLPQDGY
ncbi:M16 family metallopeptidase [Richelia intracellularis]|uniref:M16 family metallopeptidase n=1 Tax=Richelia intracellularis TaxID=1164990 RepID=UPI0005C62A5F|nr:pitrilysin family protein [Richelia intracellularis]